MKKISLLLIAAFVMVISWAQSPEKMSYQAVIRNSDNALVTNHHVGMRLSIIQGSSDGTVVYVETHVPSTNSNGLATVEIGTGTVVSGSLSTINWAQGPYFLKTEMDPTGDVNYTLTGTSQLLSVPYALHAKTAEQISGPISINETDPVYLSSQAANITLTDINNLSNLSGINTGDQDLSGYATLDDLDNKEASILNGIQGEYITEETDPVFKSSAAADITTSDIDAWNAASGSSNEESDPVFEAWDKDYADLSNTPTTITTEQTAAINLNTSKLAEIEEGAEVNVQADWSATSGDALILNKPDLTEYAQTANVLTKDNTVPFTPDADYEPATKRYVDEKIGSTGERYIGELYGGGIIFWLSPNKQHGLIASLADLSDGVAWGLWGTDVLGARSATDGEANTLAIVAAGVNADSAVGLCNSYAGGGYTDWYLPSNRELALMARMDITIDYVLDNDGDPETQGFVQEYGAEPRGRYWSSTEYGDTEAWGYNFLYHRMYYYPKSRIYRVRAIRAF